MERTIGVHTHTAVGPKVWQSALVRTRTVYSRAFPPAQLTKPDSRWPHRKPSSHRGLFKT